MTKDLDLSIPDFTCSVCGADRFPPQGYTLRDDQRVVHVNATTNDGITAGLIAYFESMEDAVAFEYFLVLSFSIVETSFAEALELARVKDAAGVGLQKGNKTVAIRWVR